MFLSSNSNSQCLPPTRALANLMLSVSSNLLALTSVDQFYLFILRSDNNKIMVENYGDTVQDRQIPNPVRTFGEAYADFRKSHLFVKVIPRETHM